MNAAHAATARHRAARRDETVQSEVAEGHDASAENGTDLVPSEGGDAPEVEALDGAESAQDTAHDDDTSETAPLAEALAACRAEPR